MHEAAFHDLGERLTRALITGDFDLNAGVMGLPLRIEPREGLPYEMHGLAALEDDFARYHRNIQLHGVTDIVRQVKGIKTLSPTEIEVTCLVNLLSDATRVVDPFLSRMVMRNTDDGWRFSRIQSSLGHINWTLGQGGIEDGSFI